MNKYSEKTLLAGVPSHRYAGRLDQIARLYLHAVSGAEPFGLRVSSSPKVGASELLRQVYDRLFREQRFVVPFYFAVRPGDGTGESAAARYLYQFVLQAIAFRRNDRSLLSASPDICELAKLAPLADADWVDRLCEVCEKKGSLNDGRANIRSALAGPLRAAAGGKMRVCVMIDDLHESAALQGGSIFIDELLGVFANARNPFIFGGRRRFNPLGFDFEKVELGALSRNDSVEMIELSASDAGVSVSEQARDLIAVQLNGNPSFIHSTLRSARESNQDLSSFRDVEQVYADEILAGGIGKYFSDVFSRAAPHPSIRRKLIELLYFAFEPNGERFSLAALHERLGISVEEFERLTRFLDLDEILDVDTGSASVRRNDLLGDFLQARYRLDEERMSPASVSAETVTSALNRAPQLMGRVYRREAAVGLQDLMQHFDLQDVPRGLLDYRIFRDRYKGLSDEEVREQLAAETDKISLPQISHAASISEHYPPFAEFIEPDRAIVGIGFINRAYRDEDRAVWLAAEIDSKLEADRTFTEEWCRRLDQAAAASAFSNYKIWLIAPEGFSDGAIDLLSERQGYGSSRRQIDLLRGFLKGDGGTDGSEAAEYEMVVPIGEDTELIAAHALEEIARRYDFPAKTINQIKTALVEACINAAEHSHSPDRKIYQRFAVDRDKIVITVSNRGLRLMEKGAVSESEPAGGRRGWGLNLIRGLMDDVRIESVDDGTRIVMTKYLSVQNAGLT